MSVQLTGSDAHNKQTQTRSPTNAVTHSLMHMCRLQDYNEFLQNFRHQNHQVN